MAKETGWTNGNADEDFTQILNWDNGVAVDGDTINIKNATAPTSNRPTTGTFHFKLETTLTLSIDSWLNGATMGNVEVKTNVITQGADWTCTNFTLTSGTIVGTGRKITVNGAPLYTAGTATALTIEQDGTNTAEWNTTVQLLLEYRVAATGAITLSNDLNALEVNVLSGGTVDTNGHDLQVYVPTANDFCNIAGAVTGTGNLGVVMPTSRSNSGRIKATNVFLRGGDDTWTQSGEFDCDTTLIYSSGDGLYGELVLTGIATSLGAVTLGTGAGTDRHGKLDISGASGTVTMTSLADAAGGSSAFTIGARQIYLSGTMNGANIAVTNTTGVVSGGTVNNVDVSGSNPLLHAPAAAAGAGNTDVTDVVGGIKDVLGMSLSL